MSSRTLPQFQLELAKDEVPPETVKRSQLTVWRVNIPFLIGSLVVAIVGGVGLYFWHEFQVHNQSHFLLTRARTLYAEEKWRAAADTYHLYLQMYPQVHEALVHRAKAFDRSDTNSEQAVRSVSLYFAALESAEKQAAAEEVELRIRLAELLIDDHVRRYDDATGQIRRLLIAGHDTVEVRRLLTTSLASQAGGPGISLAMVDQSYQEALGKFRGDIPLSVRYVDFLTKYKSRATAEFNKALDPGGVLDTMVEMHPKEAEASLARYEYRRMRKLPTAEMDLEQALKIAPSDPNVLMAALAAVDSINLDRGRALADRLLASSSQMKRPALASIAVSQAYRRWNQPKLAVEYLEKGLKSTRTDRISLERELVQAQLQAGEIDKSLQTLRQLQSELVKIGHRLPTPVRRRLGEEMELSEAQLLFLSGKVWQALPTIKRLATGVTESDDLEETLRERERRLKLLAVVYSSQNLHDQAAATCELLVRVSPLSAENQLLAARECQLSGNVERAISHLEAAANSADAPKEVWVNLVELKIEQQLKEPHLENRNWHDVDIVLERASPQLRGEPLFDVIQAMTFLARNQADEAKKKLQSLANNPRVPVTLLPRVAYLLDSAGDREAADAVVAKMRSAEVSSESATRLQAELKARRGDSAAAVVLLQQVRDQGAAANRNGIDQFLVRLEFNNGEFDEARQRLKEMMRADPATELWACEMSGDLAAVSIDRSALQNLIEHLKSHHSQAGAESRDEAADSLCRLLQGFEILETEAWTQSGFTEVENLIAELESMRPGWNRIHTLRGRVADKRQRDRDAIRCYEQAVAGGARDLPTMQWLVAALYRQKRPDEAAAYLQRWGQIAGLNDTTQVPLYAASLQSGDLSNSVQLARAGVQLRPNDALARVCYGQALTLAGQSGEAETTLKKAIRLSPQDGRTWDALIWFYTVNQQRDRARGALNDKVEALRPTPFEKTLILARGLAEMGDRDNAAKLYDEAIGLRPHNGALLEEVGRFYLGFDHGKALMCFREALQANPETVYARRAIAVITARSGTDEEWNKVSQQLHTLGDEEDLNRRLEVGLLLVRGGKENAQKAAELAEALIGQKGPKGVIAQDILLYVRALDQLEKAEEAQGQFARWMEAHPSDFGMMSSFVEFLTRHGKDEEADTWLKKLEERDPADQRALALRIHWLSRLKRGSEIDKKIDGVLELQFRKSESKGQRAAILRSIAALLTAEKMDAAAERRFRQAYDLSPDESYGALAVCLAESGRGNEALRLCLARSQGPDRQSVTQILLQVMTNIVARSSSEKIDPELQKQALAMIEQVSKDNLALTLDLGVLRAMQGRHDEAIVLYEQVLQKEPRNPIALNNLAMMLIEVPAKKERGIELIQQAIDLLPDSLELQDSKALVLMSANRVPEAQQVMERLCQQEPLNPRYRLHLGIALAMVRQQEGARQQFQLAAEQGIDRELLSPRERRMWQEAVAADSKPAAKGQ